MIVNLLARWIPALIIALLGVPKLVGNRQVVHELTAWCGTPSACTRRHGTGFRHVIRHPGHIQARVLTRVLLLRRRDRDGTLAR